MKTYNVVIGSLSDTVKVNDAPVTPVVAPVDPEYADVRSSAIVVITTY
jgi:hypothetical protein